MDVFGPIKTWALIIITTLFLGGATAGYFYYTHTQAQIVQLEIDKASLTAANEVLEQANVDVQTALNGVIDSINEVAASRDYNRRRIDAQEIAKTAKSDAARAQEILNENQKLRSRCLEIASGSPVTEADAANTVCPKLVGATQ